MVQQKKLNILLVEDSEPDIKITERAFNNAQLKNNLFIVRDGQDCLDFVRHKGAYQDMSQYPRPDLILLDINLPRVNGFDVLSTLKEDSEHKNIPIIMLSGSSNQEDIARSYQSGASCFIQKPVEYDTFANLIEVFNFYWQRIVKLPQW